MKILTWNMGFPFHRSKHQEAWKYLINDIDPDIALLQETVPSNELEDSGKVLWQVDKGNAWGSGIYVKSGDIRPIILDGYRGRVCVAEVPSHDLVLVSIHSPIDSKGYVMPHLYPIMDLIQPLISGRHFILGGDFNSSRLFDELGGTTHHNEFFDNLELNGFFNCHRKFHSEEQQTFFGPKAKHPHQIDHIFVDENSFQKVLSCKVLDYVEPLSSFSDHAPILMELE